MPDTTVRTDGTSAAPLKLICSDFDGTLCRNGQITDADRDAIDRFRADGNLFGIVTGRGIRSILHALGRYDFRADFIVANNGGLICGDDGEIKTGFPADGTILKELCAYLIKNGSRYVVVDSFEDERSTRDEGWNTPRPFHQISIGVSELDESTALVAKINAEWGSYVTAHQNGVCIDITAAGVSKSTGVAQLARLFGVRRDNIFTVGDQLNDYPMVRDYHGCAVSEAADGLKAAAERIVNDIAGVVSAAEAHNATEAERQ